MIRAAILAVLLLVAGCETPGRVTTGGPAAQPEGHRLLCQIEPGPECGK